MWRRLALLAAGLGWLPACASPAPHAAPQRVAVAEVPPSDEPAQVLAPRENPKPRFAPSPITGLAESFVELVRDALEGRIPESFPFPPEESPTTERLVRKGYGEQDLHVPPTRDLDFFLFGIELDLIPAPEPATPASTTSPGSEPRDLKATVILLRSGLKLAMIEGSMRSQPLPETGPVTPIGEVARGMRAALCEQRAESFFIGEEDRPVFANDKLFDKIMQEIPTGEKVVEARGIAQCSRPLEGISVDDVIVVARSPQGDFWGFGVGVGHSSEGPVLNGSHLIEVSRISPESL